MISLVVRLDVLPERLEEFTEAITRNATSTFGDEPGCLRFDVCRSQSDPHHFVFYEIYRDEAALDAREEAERNKEPLPPVPTKPEADRPFILDGLIQ